MSDMQVVSIDYETKLVSQEEPVPPPVCLAFHWPNGCSDLIHAKDPACRAMITDLLEDTEIHLSGFYSAFDMNVTAVHFDLLEQVHAAYADQRIHCTMVRQKLIDIARGEHRGKMDWRTGKFVEYKYNLGAVGPRHGIEVQKEDTWRLRYGELIDTPIVNWEDDAVAYPLKDVLADQTIFHSQQMDENLLEDQYRRAYLSFCLARISYYGLGTSKYMVDRYRALVQSQLDEYKELLHERHFIKLKADGKYKSEQKKMLEYARRWCVYKGITLPETKTGRPSLAMENIEKYRNKLITAYASFGSSKTLMDRVEELEMGANGLRIHTRFDECLKSGRTSSSNPNIQNRSTKAGDRECFVADPGFCFADADADGLELRTIAQTCINTVGQSRLAEFLNSGEDPHLEVAAKLLGISYDEAKVRHKQRDPDIADARGAGKAKMVNFSCWAGTSVKGLYYHMTEAGLKVTMEYAGQLFDAFRESWPEYDEYKKWVREHGPEIHTIRIPGSDRIAGGLSMTEAMSISSQGLGADATQEALRALIREVELDRTSILYGCTVPNYIHDQFLMQIPDDDLAHDRAIRFEEVFRTSMNLWLPDVPTRAKPMLCYRWSKYAEPVYDSDKRLLVWDFDMMPEVDSQGRPWPKNTQLVRQWAIEENHRQYSQRRGNLNNRSKVG